MHRPLEHDREHGQREHAADPPPLHPALPARQRLLVSEYRPSERRWGGFRAGDGRQPGRRRRGGAGPDDRRRGRDVPTTAGGVRISAAVQVPTTTGGGGGTSPAAAGRLTVAGPVSSSPVVRTVEVPLPPTTPCERADEESRCARCGQHWRSVRPPAMVTAGLLIGGAFAGRRGQAGGQPGVRSPAPPAGSAPPRRGPAPRRTPVRARWSARRPPPPVGQQTIPVTAGAAYTLTAWVRGAFVFLGASGTAAGDVSIWTPGTNGSYAQLKVQFTGGSTPVRIWVHGWYAQGTYQADDASLQGPGTAPPPRPPTTPRRPRRRDPPAPAAAARPATALPKHFLTGYWHNFVNPAVELRLRTCRPPTTWSRSPSPTRPRPRARSASASTRAVRLARRLHRRRVQGRRGDPARARQEGRHVGRRRARHASRSATPPPPTSVRRRASVA